MLKNERRELTLQANTVQAIGVVCPACQAVVPPPSISVQLENAIRAHVSRYYLGWTQCDGEGCGARTRMMSVYGRRCLGFEKEGCRGTVKLEVSFFQVLFHRPYER
jgi:DNA polymerase alpha subunit A